MNETMAQQLSRTVARSAKCARDEEDGQALVEYSLITALLALAVLAGLSQLSGGINGLFETVINNL